MRRGLTKWTQTLIFGVPWNSRTSRAEQIDGFRSEVITNYTVVAAELEDERVWWLHNKVHPTLRMMLRDFHGPLFFKMLDDMGYEDTDLKKCMEESFPCIGKLGPSFVNTSPVKVNGQELLSEEELRELRSALNHRVISKLKPSEHSQQIMDKMLEDYAEGAIE